MAALYGWVAQTIHSHAGPHKQFCEPIKASCSADGSAALMMGKESRGPGYWSPSPSEGNPRAIVKGCAGSTLWFGSGVCVNVEISGVCCPW